MTDPTAIEDVKVPDPSFMDDYDTGGDFTPPPQVKEPTPTGKYKFVEFTLQAPNVSKIKVKDEKGAWLKTKAGFLMATYEGAKDVTSGYELGITFVGTEQYNKWKGGQKTDEKRHASPALDYFRAHGIDARGLTHPEQYREYFEATADRQFKVTLDWSAFDNDSKTEVAGKYEDFPDAPTQEQALASDATQETRDAFETFARLYPGVDPKGRKIPFITKNGKKFWARAQVKRYLSALPE